MSLLQNKHNMLACVSRPIAPICLQSPSGYSNERIVQAIIDGDGDAAAHAMRQHISAGGQAFVEAAMRAPSLESTPSKPPRRLSS